MAILNYTTKIDHYKTISELQAMLAQKGAQQITINHENNLPVGITFSILWEARPIYFKIPCNFNGVLQAMSRSKRVPKSLCNREQALKVGWRIVQDWIKAQLAIVEAEVASMPEVFLPYAITQHGNTLFDYVQGKKELLQHPQA